MHQRQLGLGRKDKDVLVPLTPPAEPHSQSEYDDLGIWSVTELYG